MGIGAELLNAPFPEMIKSLGMGIAEAQYALDQVSIRITQLMAGFKLGDDGKLQPDDTSLILLQEGGERYSLLALGFTPTFYQFVETVIELKMSISMKTETNFSISTSVKAAAVAPFAIVAASVNASYSQKYQYSAEGSSLMRTTLVTMPSPTILEQRIKEIMVADRIEKEKNKS
jgi:hypothetical protein